MLLRLPLAFAVLAAILAPALAQTADVAPGHVAARAFSRLPAPLAFAIEAGENTTENIALTRRIAAEAAARGVDLGQADTTMVLRFDTEVRTNLAPTAPRSFSRERSGAAVPDSGAAGPPGARDEVANLLSSQGEGIIGRRSPPAPDCDRCLRYVINAMLDDRATGRRLWQGHVSYDTTATDRTAMFVSLAPVLVEQIGKTTQQHSFRLD